jgi:hypothetical protein
MKSMRLMFLLVVSLVCNGGAEVPLPPDIPAPDITAPEITAPDVPAPDVEASAVSVPSPLPGGQEAQAVAQPLTGTDITVLSEQSSGIPGVDNPQIINLYRKAVAILAAMAPIVDKPLEQRKQLYEDYFDLDALLTDFFESSSLGKAMIQETLKADQEKQAEYHADVAAARLKLQAVDPEAVTKKKEKLKEILALCDADITSMRDIELNAHKEAMNIVNQPTVQAAEIMFNKVNQHAKDLTAKAHAVTDKITKDFQVTAQEIRTLLQTFKESLRNLQDEWAQAQAADEAALKAAEAAKAKELSVATAQAVPQAVKEQVQPQVTPQQEPAVAKTQETFANYMLRRMTDIAVGAWEVINDTYQWFLERIGYADISSKKS